jgi:8-oxo-dGTP pyrophosphatase MutT (NUDIX family)
MGRREQVISLLDGYVPDGAEDAAAAARMRALAVAADDPFDRDHHVPGHFTASAFVVRRGRLLLVLHRKLQRWLQPGGHIEPGDASPLDAARREAAEETGLTGLRLLHHGLFDADVHRLNHDGVEHEHFDLRFLFDGGDADATAGDGVDDVRWAALADLAGLGADASIMRAAGRLPAGS